MREKKKAKTAVPEGTLRDGKIPVIAKKVITWLVGWGLGDDAKTTY